jgi:hypothetical protein
MNFIINVYLREVIVELGRCRTFAQPSLKFFPSFVPVRWYQDTLAQRKHQLFYLHIRNFESIMVYVRLGSTVPKPYLENATVQAKFLYKY